MTRELSGIIPPLTTPFTPAGDVYEAGLRDLVEFQIAGGSHGLFICGTYGSGPIMTLEERKQVHELVIDQAKGRITIVAHVGTASTSQSVELARHAEAAGADYVASISPFYHRHDERTIVEFFRELVAAVDIPVYVYNNPKASGVEIAPSLLRRLADVGVRGIKDSGFSYINFAHFVLEMAGDYPDFRFIVGTEGIALPAFMAGAKGCVSGLANAFPELMVKPVGRIRRRGLRESGATADACGQSAQAAPHPLVDQRSVLRRAPRPRRGCRHAETPNSARRGRQGAQMLAAFEEMGLL